jgi:hypothetical protein
MKKIIVCAAVLIIGMFMAQACGKMKTLPTSTLELAYGGPDNTTYPFESAGDNTIFTFDGTQFIPTPVVSTDRAYMGNSSLKLPVHYSAGNSQGILKITGTNLQMANKTITFHVWVPAGMFDNNSYGGFIYMKLANYRWYQNIWQNLLLPVGSAAGRWNTVSVNVNDMYYNGVVGNGKLSANGDDANTATEWGVIVGQGGTSPNYDGFIYIDSINVQ